MAILLKRHVMRKNKTFKELSTEISKIPANSYDKDKFTNTFDKLVKQLEISIIDNIYLQPFKLEYDPPGGGLKDYFIGYQ